jgi:DNA-binding NtrC family response regulator
MIVASEAMRGVRRTLDVAAGFESTVLILGETGVGKEVAARRVHEKSRRAGGPFVAVDCTTLTDSLMESQLFGHAKGAFTGADREAKGFVRAADGGTLFLDEIGELSLAAQAKLLRVLQERAVTPIGATRAVPVNIRVVAATHRDLKQMVDQGKFRQDLFFRLNVVRVTIPGLRQRIADIVPLAEHLLSMLAASYEGRAKSLSADACSMLMAHDWPGNVRELANAMEHAFIFSSGDTIEACDLPDSVHRSPTDDVLTSSLADDELATLAACEVSAEDDGDIDATDAADAAAAVDEVLSIAEGGVVPLHVAERELIRRALAQSGGLQSRAAELLQIERRRLYRKVRAYGLGGLTMRGQSA